MDGVRAPGRHRAPSRLDVQDELFGWMCIQGAAIGVNAAAIQQAFDHGDHGWAAIFVVMAIALLVCYFWCATAWAKALFE